MSMPLIFRCHASGRDYTAYATNNNPDATGRMACPVCGKVVKLLPKQRACATAPARNYIVIPAHNRLAANAEFRRAE